MATKKPKIYHANGRVVDGKTSRAVRGLLVQAWDRDLIRDAPLGSSITDASGMLSIAFDQSAFAELFLDRDPDLYFKVYDGGALIASTEDSVLWNVRSEVTTVEIEVDTPQVTIPVDVTPVQDTRCINGSVIDHTTGREGPEQVNGIAAYS